MLLSDIITAYQAAADALGYTFVSGSKEDVVDVASNDKRSEWLWLDRPVTGQFDNKVLRTKSGFVSYQLQLHSIQPYYQDLEAETSKQVIYDNHVTRLINFLGEVHIENTMLARALRQNSQSIFEHKVFMGEYIGVLVTLNYELDYCV